MRISVITLFLSVGALAVPWGLYPVLCALRRRSVRPQVPDGDAALQSVAVVIATRDDPRKVSLRVVNILDAEQEARVVSVVVGVDPNGPWAPNEYESVSADPRVTIVQGARPGGKALTLNVAVESSPESDLLLIADTAQTFAPAAIRNLATAVVGEQWNGASGVVRPVQRSVLGKIWARFELGIRSGQSAARGLVTTSGAITLLRRDAWIPCPAGTICDDLYLTMSVALQGGKIGLCPGAVAVDPRRVEPRQSFQKKVRTLTGLWQYVLELEPSALNPVRNPLWLDFFAHKIMRLATPPLALVAIGSAVATVQNRTAVLLITVATALALGVAAAVRTLRWRIATLFAPVLATWNGLHREWNVWHIEQDPK